MLGDWQGLVTPQGKGMGCAHLGVGSGTELSQGGKDLGISSWW